MMLADVGAVGPVDETGAKNPDGSYVRICVKRDGLDARHYRISIGAVVILIAELRAALLSTSDASRRERSALLIRDIRDVLAMHE